MGQRRDLDPIERIIGECDNSFRYFVVRALMIGVVLNPLLWIFVAAILCAAAS